MRDSNRTWNNRETATLLAATVACYMTAAACVLVLSYSLVTLAARDLGRQAVAAVVAQHDL